MLIGFCKATEIVTVNGKVGDFSGDYTYVTHNGRSTIDYFVAEYSVFDSIIIFSVDDFEPCLSDKHCLVKVELSKDENVSNASREIEANDSSAVIGCNALIGKMLQNTAKTEGGFPNEK